MSVAALGAQDKLIDTVERLHALENAARLQLLVVVASMLDGYEFWFNDGARSLGNWLAMRLGVTVSLGRDLELVASRLESLPRITEAFRRGELSWERFVLLSRFVDADLDAEFAERGPLMTLAQLRRLSDETHDAKAVDMESAFDLRSLTFRRARNGFGVRFEGFLPSDFAATVQAAVERIADAQGADHRGLYAPAHQRNADALVELCSVQISEDADADRATVTVEADLAALTAQQATVAVGAFGVGAKETLDRYLCDCRLQLAAVNEGRTVGVGRMQRTFPRWLRRRLARRDQSCRFPGCQRRRWLQGHHVVHWTAGGVTDESNGLMLCAFHHRFVHEHGWTIEGDVYGDLSFVSPGGGRYPKPVNPYAEDDVVELIPAASSTVPDAEWRRIADWLGSSPGP